VPTVLGVKTKSSLPWPVIMSFWTSSRHLSFELHISALAGSSLLQRSTQQQRGSSKVRDCCSRGEVGLWARRGGC
jgi:hypothetical protein